MTGVVEGIVIGVIGSALVTAGTWVLSNVTDVSDIEELFDGLAETQPERVRKKGEDVISAKACTKGFAKCIQYDYVIDLGDKGLGFVDLGVTNVYLSVMNKEQTKVTQFRTSYTIEMFVSMLREAAILAKTRTKSQPYAMHA